MSEKFSRRDFLKLAGIGAAALPFAPYVELPPVPEMNIVGPKLDLICKSPDGASPGDRAIYFDANGSGFGVVGVQQGAPGEGYWTANLGKTWNRVDIPVSERSDQQSPSTRFFEPVGKNLLLAVSDYSVAIGKIESGSLVFDKVYPEGNKDTRMWQCACLLPNNRVLLGGTSISKGLAIADLDDIQQVVMLNKIGKINRNFEWDDIYKDLKSKDAVQVRTLTYDPLTNLVFYAGWINPYTKTRGFGIHCLDATTLKPVGHPFIAKDKAGELPVNDIHITYEYGHQFVFIGCERSGSQGNLLVYVDGVQLDPNFVNSRKIIEDTGGIDIITCANGIKTLTINNEKYIAISSYSNHISIAKLVDFISYKNSYVNWSRVTQNPHGSSSFGAVHIGTTRDKNGNDIIYSGRIVYGDDNYQPCAFIKFS